MNMAIVVYQYSLVMESVSSHLEAMEMALDSSMVHMECRNGTVYSIVNKTPILRGLCVQCICICTCNMYVV